MKLYLLQHGDALPEEVNPDRPLSEPGRDDVKRLAEFVGRCGIRVQRVHHSGKTRARETADIVAVKMAAGATIEATAGLNPNDAVEPWVERINMSPLTPTLSLKGRGGNKVISREGNNAGWKQDTLLVGHMPFLGRLAARLLSGNGSSQFVAFKPGSMLCMERDETGRWGIAWMLRPELLSGNL